MSAKKKTVFKAFDYLHCDDFARYLEEMAAKGWHFKEWGIGLTVEKGEPEQVTYAVEVFTGASEYDMRPEPHTKAFAEYCEAAGWKLIDAKQKFTIFKKVQEDAVPILTPEERLQNVCKEYRRNIIPSLILCITMLLMQVSKTFSDIYFPSYIFSPLSLSLILMWTIALLDRLVKITGLLWWKYKGKQKLARGQTIYLGNESGKVKVFSRWGFWLAIIVEVLCVVMIPKKWILYLVVFFIGLVLSVLILGMVLAKLRPESNTNFIIQTVFSMFYVVTILVVAVSFGTLERQDRIQTDAPLVKEDYVEHNAEIKKIILYADGNIFGSRQSYHISYEPTEEGYSNGLHYAIYVSENDWIMDRIWDVQTETWSHGEVVDCAEEWGAETAFYDEGKEYFIRYENMIVTIEDYDDVVFTQDQIDIIRDKLDLR